MTERRTSRPDMIQIQLEELDTARTKVMTDLKEKTITPRDLVFVVDALVKIQNAERSLYDEANLGEEDKSESDVDDLLE